MNPRDYLQQANVPGIDQTKRSMMERGGPASSDLITLHAKIVAADDTVIELELNGETLIIPLDGVHSIEGDQSPSMSETSGSFAIVTANQNCVCLSISRIKLVELFEESSARPMVYDIGSAAEDYAVTADELDQVEDAWSTQLGLAAPDDATTARRTPWPTNRRTNYSTRYATRHPHFPRVDTKTDYKTDTRNDSRQD